MGRRLVARAICASANGRRLTKGAADEDTARTPSRDAGGTEPRVSRASTTTKDVRRAVPGVSRERDPDRRRLRSRARREVRARRFAGCVCRCYPSGAKNLLRFSQNPFSVKNGDSQTIRYFRA